MKRDMDLVRRILIELSESDVPLDAEAFVGWSATLEKVCYHFRIMDQAGLISASVQYAGGEPYFARATGLTWDGNDFLAAVRSDPIWSKVKMRIAKATVDAPIEVFKAVAVRIATDALMGGA